MRASILTIGDELLIGQVLNSNAQWIGSKLTDLGLNVAQQLTVGDNSKAITEALDYLRPRSDVILIGGGLGPTHDDITLEVLSKYLKMPQEYDHDWLAQMTGYFKSRNRPMAESNKKQALLLKGSTRIDNDCGTAAGQYFTSDKVQYFVFPGVPHEMKSMMERFIAPTLQKQLTKTGEHILKQTLLTTGIGESMLAERCDPFVQKIKSMPNVSLSFLPSSILVKLRLQMTATKHEQDTEFDKLIDELKNCCGKDFYGFDPITLEEIVLSKLKAEGATLAIAESCTGGLVTHRLTQVPGASSVLKGTIVPYQTVLKHEELEIPPRTIDTHGVVSEQVAKAMAWAIQKKWSTTYAISTTGYLGPSGGDKFAKVGTICLGFAGPNGMSAKTFYMEANRERAKERAAQAALDLLRRELKS
ncbi:MAG: competence/damage-inducible protein A [Bdellovibrionales bacterium]|nr:competence/damage-inducible protein A [Bdellovibrionales bacterium]